ncbi:MAG TPA: PadR family transcriptional regulator [Promineifilum sp.]|nr:PadR family transcriptional regulator [Promineifilum sp.]
MSPLLQAPLSTELALLGFVYREPLHAYEIHRRLSESPEIKSVWRMKQSRLYALLSRLEEDGLLHTTTEPQENRPPRKIYHLTPIGEQAFKRWLTEPVRIPREMRLDFMLKLYFALDSDQGAAVELIRRQQAVCNQWLLIQSGDDPMSGPYLRFVRRYRRGHIEAIQSWLASLSNELVLSIE